MIKQITTETDEYVTVEATGPRADVGKWFVSMTSGGKFVGASYDRLPDGVGKAIVVNLRDKHENEQASESKLPGANDSGTPAGEAVAD